MATHRTRRISVEVLNVIKECFFSLNERGEQLYSNQDIANTVRKRTGRTIAPANISHIISRYKLKDDFEKLRKCVIGKELTVEDDIIRKTAEYFKHIVFNNVEILDKASNIIKKELDRIKEIQIEKGKLDKDDRQFVATVNTDAVSILNGLVKYRKESEIEDKENRVIELVIND